MFFSIKRGLSDRRSHYEPSVPGEEQPDQGILDEHDVYVPHFQRVSISGEDTSGVCVFKPFIFTNFT